MPSDESPKPSKLEREWENLVSFFVQYYNLHGEILTAEKAHEEYGVPFTLVVKALASKPFREALEEQGVVFQRDKNNWTSKALTPTQLLVANSLLDLVDTRSQKKKLQDLQVSTQQYNAWLRDPVFKDYLQTRAEQLLGDSAHEAHTALIDKVRAGDIKAISYFNEITGRFVASASKQQGTSVADIQNLLVRIIEIIDFHVKDTDAKLAIAEEFKKLIAARNMAGSLVGMDNDPIAIPDVSIEPIKAITSTPGTLL